MNDVVKQPITTFPQDPRSAVEAIDAILACAVAAGASDIHLDPTRSDVLARFRIDGIMEPAGIVSRSFHEEMIARLKILSGVRTDVHLVPQDGRFQAEITGQSHNVRISFMPTYHGENAVMRLLPVRMSGQASFARLGFTPDHVRAIARALERANGLILVTGPTGSGKTTTLHSCLAEKSREPLSVITLEDPVEYEIAGVRQVHVRHSYGVTFASGLRAALRQDPDVIMLGEIRDAETAGVAIHTALTGHLVLSTLHTNSALETIPRLIDMGIDHYLLATTLRLIIGQRLVRTICQECQAEGCESCRRTGYRGRAVIAEVCEVDQGLKDRIAGRATLRDCADYVLSRGFRSMSLDGDEKVEWGQTTRQEVIRVLSTEVVG